MTLTNELGINELIQGFPETILNTSLNYIKNNKISFVQFIGILSLFDYINNKNEEHYPKLKEYFKYNFLKDIYIELEKIKPIFKNIENISSKEIQELLESQLSKDLINQVAYSEIITLKQNYAHRGIYNLFYLLLEIDLSNFENWIIKTTRTDFKIIFLNTIFCCYTNSNVVLDSLDKSNIGIIQAFYALRRFKIDKMCRNIDCSNENIDLLFETNLSKKNKFIIYLQYITKKYHGLKLKQLEEHNEFEKDINKFNEFDYNYTEEEFFDFINVYYSRIGFKIIQTIQNEEKKQIFFKKFQNRLLNYLSKERFIDNNIDYANLIGFAALELNSCDNLEKIFNTKYKKLSFPYSFCKIKDWDEQVVFMFYLLIGLYIYKKTKNEDFHACIENLNFVIGDIKCFTIKNFNEYIEQMK